MYILLLLQWEKSLGIIKIVLHLSFFWGSNYMYIRPLDTVPQLKFLDKLMEGNNKDNMRI